MEKNEIQENNILNKKQVPIGLGAITQNWIQDFLKQLTERLEKMEEVLVVDRLEGNIAICENRKTKEMKNIPLSELPRRIQEGSILKWQKGKYELDTSKEIEKRVNYVLEAVNMYRYRNRPAKMLSGGEKQRVRNCKGYCKKS